MSSNPYLTGMTHTAKQEYDAAVADYQKALRHNPYDIWSTFQLGYAYHQKNWQDEALKEYQAAGQPALEVANMAYHNSGVILQNKGQLDEAAVAYKRSLGANPLAANSLGNLLLIYESRKDDETALHACQTYLEANPKNPAISFRAGQLAERLGRRDMAVRYYQSALANDPNSAARERLKVLAPK